VQQAAKRQDLPSDLKVRKSAKHGVKHFEAPHTSLQHPIYEFIWKFAKFMSSHDNS
jgi:hypothetical protein